MEKTNYPKNNGDKKQNDNFSKKKEFIK